MIFRIGFLCLGWFFTGLTVISWAFCIVMACIADYFNKKGK